MTDETQKLRKTIGQLFEQLPDLENIELTHGGQRYRARRTGCWVCMDVKADGRGWNDWTEWALPAFYRWQSKQANAGAETGLEST
jgi:hypothetical protein